MLQNAVWGISTKITYAKKQTDHIYAKYPFIYRFFYDQLKHIIVVLFSVKFFIEIKEIDVTLLSERKLVGNHAFSLLHKAISCPISVRLQTLLNSFSLFDGFLLSTNQICMGREVWKRGPEERKTGPMSISKKG